MTTISLRTFFFNPSEFNKQSSLLIISSARQRTVKKLAILSALILVALIWTDVSNGQNQQPAKSAVQRRRKSAGNKRKTNTFKTIKVKRGTDGDERCCYWALKGECNNNPYYMRPICQQSCGTKACKLDRAWTCPVSLNISSSCKWIDFMDFPVPSDFGKWSAFAQNRIVNNFADGVRTLLPNGQVRWKLPEQGTDGHKFCCYWALKGECERNIFWMRPFCQKSCGTKGCQVSNAASCKLDINLDDCPWTQGRAWRRECVERAKTGHCFTGSQSRQDWMRIHCRKYCAALLPPSTVRR